MGDKNFCNVKADVDFGDGYIEVTCCVPGTHYKHHFKNPEIEVKEIEDIRQNIFDQRETD
jgi:hypothetical protein